MTDVGSRRNQILRVAAEQFTNKGYHGTAVDEIGEGAGITGPALYRHFPNKQALLNAVVVEGMQALLSEAECTVAKGGDAAAVLRALVEMRVDFALGPNRLVFPLHRSEERNLTEASLRRVTAMSELYRTEWLRVLAQVKPTASTSELHTAFYAAHTMIGFTAFQEHGVRLKALREHLVRMATAALLA